MKYPNHGELKTPFSEILRVFLIRLNDLWFKVIAGSEPDGWDHLSVSLPDRCPNWDEMCAIKDMFFEPEEACIQIHPRESEYINLSEHCLHIWKPPAEIGNLLERGYE